MWALFFKNLFFTLVQPGIVAGLIPYWIIKDSFFSTVHDKFNLVQYAGLILFVPGLITMCLCIRLFAIRGKGTLSPAVPTRKLVIEGLYNFSRNPMYIGVVVMLAGESLFFQSVNLWIYTAVIFLIFHLFIILREEPRLQRDFGDEYHAYRQKVRRWL